MKNFDGFSGEYRDIYVVLRLEADTEYDSIIGKGCGNSVFVISADDSVGPSHRRVRLWLVGLKLLRLL
jgi:hypothetical protein